MTPDPDWQRRAFFAHRKLADQARSLTDFFQNARRFDAADVALYDTAVREFAIAFDALYGTTRSNLLDAVAAGPDQPVAERNCYTRDFAPEAPPVVASDDEPPF